MPRLLLFVLILVVAWATPTLAAVVLDSSQGVANESVAGATLSNNSFPVGTGSNRLLVVCGASVATPTTNPYALPVSVTYGGVPLTQLPGSVNAVSVLVNVTMWYLVNPPSGTAVLEATWDHSATRRYLYGMVFTGVDQSVPWDTQIGNIFSISESASIRMPTASNQLLVDCVHHVLSATTVSNQTKIGETGTTNRLAASYIAGTAPYRDMTWNTTGHGGQVSASLNPVGAPYTPVTRTAASCTRADVGEQLDAMHNGDTVTIPACAETTWTTRYILRHRRGTIRGAGAISMIDPMACTSPAAAYTLSNLTNLRDGTTGTTPNNNMFQWLVVPGGLSELTGIHFKGGTAQAASPNTMLSFDGGYHTPPTLRVHHNHFDAMDVGHRPGLFWEGFALMDHNVIRSEELPYMYVLAGNFPGGHKNGAIETGNSSWSAPSSFGTNQAMFFEDNVFDASGIVGGGPVLDGHRGHRRVERFNCYMNMATGAHGNDTAGNQRSVRHRETYFNKWLYTPADALVSHYPITSRGGTGLHHNNTVDWNSSGVDDTITQFITYRDGFGVQGGAPPGTRGMCGVLVADSLTFAGDTATITRAANDLYYLYASGNEIAITVKGATGPDAAVYNGTFRITSGGNPSTTVTYIPNGIPVSSTATGTITVENAQDENLDSTGTLCQDGTGAGQGDNPNDTVPFTQLPWLWMNQVHEPVYVWANLHHGIVMATKTSFSSAFNRDIYDSASGIQNCVLDEPCTTPFNGTSGVGWGTLGRRPTTCTIGRAYWVTNEGTWRTGSPGSSGKFYKCTATNEWTAWYGSNNATGEPYVYPHPLQTGEVIEDTRHGPYRRVRY
jgi:hypothetical protein